MSKLSKNSPLRLKIGKALTCLKENIFPDRFNCIICDRELHGTSRYGLCTTCEKLISLNNGDICLKCGVHIADESSYCLSCQNNQRIFDEARSALIYDDYAAKLVYGIKFGNKKYLAKYMAAFMSDTFLSDQMEADIIVAVPLSDKRKKQRGYNQAEEIAKSLSQRLRLPLVDALVRVKQTEMQAMNSQKARMENMKGAFCLKEGADIEGLKVLLVDDVMTTAATVEAASIALFKGYPDKISVLTFASVSKKVYGERKNSD